MFCASQASTAIANDGQRVVARAVDRHNPILTKDGRRSLTAPCSSGDDYISPYRQLSKITRIPSSSSSSINEKITQVDKRRKSKLISSNTISLERKSCDVTKTPPGSDPVTLTGSTGKDEVITEEKTSGLDQVVVLRVSLHCHCRGCESKVKKHLSRMQGVTSFNIDFASKKVIVTGDITPLEVLGCLSKVKNAQFWSPPQASLPRANPEN